MGPSGSGKTSLLRLICGLDFPDSGEIIIDGKNVTGLHAKMRNVGMIFQDLAIFPHMRVYDNIAYGLRAQRENEGIVRKRVMELAELLRIDHLLQNYPGQISGGERQRVALARSVAPSPSLLLLDEPMSSLDTQLRENVRSEIKAFAKRVGLTMIYITHDHREGFYMADRAGLIFDGRLGITGAPDEIFSHPESTVAARFLGYNVIRMDGEETAFYPTDFEFTENNSSIWGTVKTVGFEGELFRLHVQLDSGETIQLWQPPSDSAWKKEVGSRLGFRLRRKVVIKD